MGGLRVASARGWWRTASLVAVALAARVVYLFVLTDADQVRSDAAQYHEIASNLATGEGFSSTFPQLAIHATAFRPPLYPGLLGLLFRITGPSVVAGKLLNVGLGLVVVLLAARVGERMTQDVRAGFAAGLFVAISPSLIANDVNLLAEPISLVLLLAIVLLLGRDRWVVAAILTGALVLTRPSAQLFVLVVAAWLVHRIGWRKVAAFVAIAALTVVPWLVRNQVQVHTWNTFTSNGFNVAAMYSAPAQQTRAFVDPVHDPRFEDQRFGQFDEAQWDRDMLRIGLDGLRSNPSYVVGVVARNTAAIFEIWPPYNEGAEREDGRNLVARNVGLPLFYAMSLLGVYGLWRSRRSPHAQLLALSAVYFVAVSLLLLAPPRLRAPWDLAACIGAGAAVVVIWDGRKRAHRDGSIATPDPAAAERADVG